MAKVKVEINFRKSAQENANEYFEEAKRAKHKIEASKKALEGTNKEIRKVKKKGIKKGSRKPRKVRRGKWFEKFRWMITTDGFLVIGGRDATQNEIIFKKHIEQNDKVLHADITGAPLTVVKSQGKDVTPLAIREAAELAAAYSSAWKKGYGSIRVYWVNPDQISKTAQAGEYLPKGSFMMRGKKNYLKKMELKIGIGVKFMRDKDGEEYAKPIAGSMQAISAHAKYFVTLKPGARSQLEAAREIRHKILVKAMPDHKQLIEDIPIEHIQKLVPAGGSFVIG